MRQQHECCRGPFLRKDVLVMEWIRKRFTKLGWCIITCCRSWIYILWSLEEWTKTEGEMTIFPLAEESQTNACSCRVAAWRLRYTSCLCPLSGCTYKIREHSFKTEVCRNFITQQGGEPLALSTSEDCGDTWRYLKDRPITFWKIKELNTMWKWHRRSAWNRKYFSLFQ